MQRTKSMLLLAGFAVSLLGMSDAGAMTMSKTEYNAQQDKVKADFKIANEKCKTMAGNAKDVCHEEAEATEKKALANAEADYKNTPKARRDALIAGANADYDVAARKCKAMSGNEKDVCIKEAKAAQTKVKADAEAQSKITDAQRDANSDKSDANYKVTIEKCDGMSGAAKDKCKADAKTRYGK